MNARSASPAPRLEDALRVLGANAIRIAELEGENTALKAKASKLGQLEARNAELAVRATRIGKLEAQIALSRMKEEDRISELEDQVAFLRKHLDGFHECHSQGNDRKHAYTCDRRLHPTGPPETEYAKLSRQLNECRDRYSKLSLDHGMCNHKIEKANSKYALAKQRIKEWQVYIDSVQRSKPTRATSAAGPAISTPSLGDVPSTASLNLNDESPLASKASAPNVLPPAPVLRQTSSTESNPLPSASASSTSFAGARSSATENPRRQITSSQTTEGETQPAQGLPPTGIKREPISDDEPTFVSTRPVKRPRGASKTVMPPPRSIKQEPNSTEHPVELQSEEFSSPQQSHHFLHRQETSDLDAVPSLLLTPRKRRLQAQSRVRAVSEDIHIRGPQLSAAHSRPASAISDGALSDLEKEKSNRSTNNIRDETLQAPRHREPLRPLSANISPAQHERKTNRASDGGKRRKGASDKLGMLSEDGDHDSSQVTPKAGHTRDQPHSTTSGKLTSLLNEDHPIQRRSLTRAKPQADRTPATTRHAAHKAPLQSTSTAKRTRPRTPADNLSTSPPPIRPEDEPLRLRQLQTLNLEDFRINPAYLGTSYAFADTLRGRDARRCLPGCTRPNCCGDVFRKAVEIGGAIPGDKTDSEVLEDYLGPDFASIMANYSAEKRQDLLMQARAHAFANRHGKHRTAFERHSTPPGFWRTDMPTTQEEEEDRRQAHEMERKKVEERWHEAMREGGRWVFRDE